MKICRDCLTVCDRKLVECPKCSSSNLGTYYSAEERMNATQVGSDWRNHLYVSGDENRTTKSKDFGTPNPKSTPKGMNRKLGHKRFRRRVYSAKAALRRSILAGISASLALVIGLNSTIWSSPNNPLDAKNLLALSTSVIESASELVADGASQFGFEAPARLLPSVGYNSNGQFKFLAYDTEGNPTGFHSPCEPIRYEVNPANEPPGAREILEAAIQSMRYYTGLEFEFVGETDEVIQKDELIPPVNPPSTLLINYFPTEEFQALPRDETYEHVEEVAGWGGPRSYQSLNEGKKQYFALGGTIALDASYIEDDVVEAAWGEPQGRVAFSIMIHELAHVVGLDHVDDKSEIMNAEASDVFSFQNGDQEGLAIAGMGACGTDLAGNLFFGKEVSDYAERVPSTCKVDSLVDTHEMFEMRGQGSFDERPCTINPFNVESEGGGLSVNFGWTSESAQVYFDNVLAGYDRKGRPDPLFEQREFLGQSCSVMAVYSRKGEQIPLYWLYVFCEGQVTLVSGYDFNPERYFESPTLISIVDHNQT